VTRERRNELVEIHVWIAESVARKLTICRPDLTEDAQQEGMVALIGAAEDFEPDLGKSFDHFAACRVTQRIVDYLRGNWQRKRLCGLPLAEMGELVPVCREDGLAEVDRRLDLQAMLAPLSQRQRRDLEDYYHNGKSLAEIGPSESAAHQRLTKAIKEARRHAGIADPEREPRRRVYRDPAERRSFRRAGRTCEPHRAALVAA